MVDRINQAPRGWAVGLGHYLHGEICRAGPDAGPLLRPRGTFAYHFDSFWRARVRAPELMAWVDESMAAMRPHSSEATYVNYLSSDDPESVRSAYGAHYRRLAALKRRYDPDNVFHRNRNIRPVP